MLRIILLISAWLLWSGHYTLDPAHPLSPEHPLIPIFGALSVALVWWLRSRMMASHTAHHPFGIGFRVIPYLLWLLWEIVKSNWDVAKIILSPRLPISPRIIRVKASQHCQSAQVLYANSITLTPGTISLDLRDNHIVVHALTGDTADGVRSGEMDAKVTATEVQR